MNSNSSQPEPIGYKLTTKNLFKHFLLVHDFLYKFTKVKSADQGFLDAQIDVQNIMNKAATRGGNFAQLIGLAGLTVYCLKSRSISLKFLAGFLYVYWFDHIHMLGQYSGTLLRMPRAYGRMGEYFEKSSIPHPNMLDKFEEAMQIENDYEDTHDVLKKIFPELYKIQQNSYTVNDYFIKNKDKYNLPSQNSSSSQNLKLPYLDSFLTRYFYYSFTRWFHRVKLFLGLAAE